MRVLEFIKTHLVALLCGGVALAAIAGGVLGMARDTVVEEMKKEISQTGASSIPDLKRDAKNEDVIASEKRRGELFENEYAETVEVANQINARKVLMGGVFPQPEKTATPFEFKEAYKKTMRVLHTKLGAEALPTEADIQEEAQNVEDLLLLEAEQKAEEEEEEEESGRGGRAPSVGRMRSAPPTGGRPFMPPMPPVYGGGRMAPGSGRMAPGSGRMAPSGPLGTRAPKMSITRSDEPKYDPVYRARVAKAKSILCYYDEASFHHSPLEYADDAPTPEEMWFAQVALWVQDDVVRAIAELNREAADRVTDGDACVEHVPVKRLVRLRVLGYNTAEAAGRFSFPMADSTNLPPGAGGPSLTARRCNEQYDVVRFIVSVVVDQRDILQLIDRLSRVNFYQCLNVSWEAVDHRLAMGEGYFYGTDPVVQATLEFEGYMAREVHEKWMPSAVRKLLGIDAEDEGD